MRKLMLDTLMVMAACASMAGADASTGASGESYQAVSYLSGVSVATNDGPYINTRYVPKCTDRFEAKIRMISNSFGQGLYCSRKGQTENVVACIMSGSKLGYWRFDRNTDNVNGLSSVKLTETTKDHVIVADYNTLKCMIDGEEVATMQEGDFTCVAPLVLMGVANGNGEPYNAGGFKLYYFKIYDKDNNLLHHYVPAHNAQGSDVRTRGGVYDLVTNEFLPNAQKKEATDPFGYADGDLAKTFTVADIPTRVPVTSSRPLAVTVTDGATVLTEGVDYEVSCLQGTKAGRATAVVTGKGNYDKVVIYKPFIISETPPLPKGYKRQNFIASTYSGDQWIHTGYVPRSVDRLEAEVTFTRVGNGDTVWCSRQKTGVEALTCFASGGNESTLRFDYGINNPSVADFTRKNQVRYTIVADYEKREGCINGVKVSGMPNEGRFLPSAPLILFGLYSSPANVENNETPFNHGIFKLHAFRVYDGDTLLREYLPAEDEQAAADSPARLGLYETVHNKFYSNMGNTAFTNEVMDCVQPVKTFRVKSISPCVLRVPTYRSMPEPRVTDAVTGEMLVKDRDYTVTYKDNTSGGTAKCLVTGKEGSDYEFYSECVSFTLSDPQLPPPYKRVESITTQKDKDQWVGTGYKPHGSDRVLVGFTPSNISLAHGIYSARQSAAVNTFSCIMPSANLGHYRFDHNTDNASAVSEQAVKLNKRYDFDVDGNTCIAKINGEVAATMASGEFQSPRSFVLLAIEESTNSDKKMNFAYGTMYYFRVLDKDGNVVCDCVPARNTTKDVATDNEACGMYDLISGNFYPNQGKAPLGCGADAPFTPVQFFAIILR